MANAISALESIGKSVFLMLVNASLQITLLILLVWFVIWMLRLRSAATRYYLWFLAVFGILALPALDALFPDISIPIARSDGAATGAMYIGDMVGLDEDAISVLDMGADMEDIPEGASTGTGQRSAWQSWTIVFRPLKQLGLVSIISLIWFAVALLMLCRLIRSYIWLRHFKRKSEKVEAGQVLEIMSRLKEQMGITRKTGVFISSAIHSPTSFGLLSTAIILPENLVNSSGEELEMILSHEMAHAKRHDYLVNLLQRILQSIFFFHPLFQMASHRLTREREHICDDWVIQATGKRDGYAECLIGLVENAYCPKSVSVAMMGHHHNISRRIDMIIDNGRGIVTGISRKAGVLILLVGLILLPMLAATRLVYTVQPEEPVELTPPILDITEERIDVPEEAEPHEEREGKPMEPGKRVRVAGIADLNLAAAIREAVGKPEGPITEADFQSVTELSVRGRGIRDITGIEKCVNLEELILSDNGIQDISPLAQLTKLTSLSIRGNGLTDITPLSGLTNLTVLSIPRNQISDLTPLANLTNLTTLLVDRNQITNIEPLSSLTNLTKLGISRNQIADITPLAKLTNLSEELHAGVNQIEDITSLSNLTNLRRLVLFGNRISDVSPLSSLTNLERLALGDNQISNVEPLAGLTNLTGLLNLSGNRITDITPLSGLTNLVALSLDGNKVSDITPLSKLTKLEKLGLRTNKVSDIKPLASLTNLTGLDIAENEISDITPLANLTKLTILYIYDNRISSVEPLSNLINLDNLAAAGNWISDVGHLSGLTGLTKLALEVNQVSDITPLSGLTNLSSLSLFNNPISDVKPLSNLTNLTDLYLNRTGISEISLLSGLTNLKMLGLIANKISDITPLSNLTNLTGLGLSENQISDITPLSNLMGLTDLRLGANRIDDVGPLSSLTELTNLELHDNRITDIKPLSKLTKLIKLRLQENQIADITPLVDNPGFGEASRVDLSGNPLNAQAYDFHIPELRGRGVIVQIPFVDLDLETVVREAIGKPKGAITEVDLQSITELEARENNISDITGIERCVNLERLMLGAENREKSSNEIEDISPLSELTKLVELSLASNKVSNIEPLSSLTNLTTLNLNNNQITDAAPLAKLTNLEMLELWENQISDIGPLSKLTNLTWLSIYGNEISDLKPLANLTNLTMLVLHDNQISDITPLSGLTNLDTLWLRGNEIRDISPLSNLSNLLKLRLEGNDISDITPLSNLTKLFRLWLDENRVSDITPLSNLTNLTVLGLESNQINDISSLVDNPGIGENDVVELKGNPLNDAAYNIHIPALQWRGVRVSFDLK